MAMGVLGQDGAVALLALATCLLIGYSLSTLDGPPAVDEALIAEAGRHPGVAAAAGVYSVVMPYVAIAAMAAVVGLLALAGEWRAAFAVLAAFALADLPQSTLKELFDRARPDGSGLPTHSYPSGHATSAAFHWGLVLLVGIPRLLGAERPSRRLVAAWLALAAVGALARVAERHHWPTDVLGGFLLGAALCLGLRRLSRAPAPATPRTPPAAAPAAPTR